VSEVSEVDGFRRDVGCGLRVMYEGATLAFTGHVLYVLRPSTNEDPQNLAHGRQWRREEAEGPQVTLHVPGWRGDDSAPLQLAVCATGSVHVNGMRDWQAGSWDGLYRRQRDDLCFSMERHRVGGCNYSRSMAASS